jgi:hypothetical protein
VLVHVALDEAYATTDWAHPMCPAAAERVARDLRHGEELEHVEAEAVQATRGEIGHDVVVEDGRQKRAAQELREGDMDCPSVAIPG